VAPRSCQRGQVELGEEPGVDGGAGDRCGGGVVELDVLGGGASPIVAPRRAARRLAGVLLLVWPSPPAGTRSLVLPVMLVGGTVVALAAMLPRNLATDVAGGRSSSEDPGTGSLWAWPLPRWNGYTPTVADAFELSAGVLLVEVELGAVAVAARARCRRAPGRARARHGLERSVARPGAHIRRRLMAQRSW
jgi:hypothetical protein